jgi:hypothetical protein
MVKKRALLATSSHKASGSDEADALPLEIDVSATLASS